MAFSLIQYGFLPPRATGFFLCDLQEKFRPAMLYFDQIVEVANKLVKTARILGIPLVVTEQNPSALGHTVHELNVGHAVGVYAKTRFSMLTPEVATVTKEICGGQLKVVVLFGVEVHVCIEQTATELIAAGFQVHIVADACTSRSQEDRLLAFQRLKQIGCFITTSETIIFKLLADKEHPKFSDIRPLIKTTSPHTGLATLSKM